MPNQCVVNPCIFSQCECFGCWNRKWKAKSGKRVKNWAPLFPFTHCRSWEESSTWMPSHSVCPRRHHEPEQAWKGVLQYRCGRFNFYGFKALPEPQTHRIRSTGNCLVSPRKKDKKSGYFQKCLVDLWNFDMVKVTVSTYQLNQPCPGVCMS